MSTPENVDNQASATAAAVDSSPAVQRALDVTKAMWQLRVLVCGLGLIVFVVSATLSVFVWKQNRNTSAETNSRINQAAQLQANLQRITPVLNELAQVSQGNPELIAVFQKFNVRIGPQPAASPAPPPSTTP
jgi:hypothetical protein